MEIETEQKRYQTGPLIHLVKVVLTHFLFSLFFHGGLFVLCQNSCWSPFTGPSKDTCRIQLMLLVGVSRGRRDASVSINCCLTCD